MNSLELNRINFTANAGFSISAVFICLCMICSYFLKKRKGKMEERSIYFILNLCSIIMVSIVEIAYVFYYLIKGTNGLYAHILYCLYAILLLLTIYFIWLFAISYRLSMNKNQKNTKQKKFFYYLLITIIELTMATMVIVMPVKIHLNVGFYTFSSITITVITIYELFSFLLFVFLLYFKNPTLTKRDLAPSTISLLIISILLLYRLITGLDVNSETFQLTILALGIFITIENQDYQLLEEAKQKQTIAKSATKSQQEFLASMSHEIRSPMNTIMGISQLYSETEKIPRDTLYDDVKEIHTSSISLLTLINNIMEYSYTISDKIEVEEKEYLTKELLKKLNKKVSDKLANTNIKYDFNITTEIPGKLLGDNDKINRILFNLLTNSTTSFDGTIFLNITGSKKENNLFQFIFIITGNPSNITKEKFDKTADEIMKTNYKETKNSNILGLLAAKSLVNKINGKLEITNEKPKEVKYYLTIEQKILDNTPITNAIKKDISREIINYNLPNKKILLVNSNDIENSTMKNILEKYNIKIEIANTGKEAIEKVKNNQYSLILIEYMMPVLNGIETLAKLKEISQTLPPTVVLVSNSYNDEKEKYEKDGFDYYLSKPLDDNEINNLLKQIDQEQKDTIDEGGLI